MIILAGTIRLGAGKREAALPVLQELVAATRAEPGNLQYAFAFDVNDDHVLRIFEVFKDAAALEAHRTSEHMAKWRTRQAELGLHDRDFAQYEVSDFQKL